MGKECDKNDLYVWQGQWTIFSTGWQFRRSRENASVTSKHKALARANGEFHFSNTISYWTTLVYPLVEGINPSKLVDLPRASYIYFDLGLFQSWWVWRHVWYWNRPSYFSHGNGRTGDETAPPKRPCIICLLFTFCWSSLYVTLTRSTPINQRKARARRYVVWVWLCRWKFHERSINEHARKG